MLLLDDDMKISNGLHAAPTIAAELAHIHWQAIVTSRYREA
jgi:hypothetical protein